MDPTMHPMIQQDTAFQAFVLWMLFILILWAVVETANILKNALKSLWKQANEMLESERDL
jgi:hypothetical protein